MNTPTKELAMYFGNVVNSRLEFLDDALHLGNLGDETERNMCINDFQNIKSHALGDLRNSGFGYKGVQNDMKIGCSRNIQSTLGHRICQPVAQDLSRHCERMINQTQTDMQPLDYSNNYRSNSTLNRVSEFHSFAPTTVICSSKPQPSGLDHLKGQSSMCSTDANRTSCQTQVDCLQQRATYSKCMESLNIVERMKLDVMKKIENNNIRCSNVTNEIVETCSSEEHRVSNLNMLNVQPEKETLECATDHPSTKIGCSNNDVENTRVVREFVNEMLDSVEQDLNTTSVDNEDKKLVSEPEKESSNKVSTPGSSSLNSSLKTAPSGVSKEKIKLFSCPECTWVFSSKPALQKHLGKKHKVKKSRKVKTDRKANPAKTTFQCNKCKCSFSERSEMKAHSLIHLKERRLKCNICSLSFNRRKDLDHHSLWHNKKPACCEICGKTFSQAGNMKIHLRIHTKEKPYTCPHCGKSYAQSGDLKTHIRVHTDDRPYLCEYCGNLFLSLSHLARHSKVHTKEKPYTCQVCGHSFAHTHHLKKHYRIHTQEKPYSCEICGKAFSRADYVKQHIRVHTKEKPYICRICGKGFSQGGSLKLHQRVHNNTR